MSDSAALTCQELVELVTDYFEEALSAAERERFEGHLAGCRHCRAYLAQMRRTLTLVGELGEESIPAAAQQTLLRAFHDWKRGAG